MAATQVFHAPVRLMPITVSHTAGVSSSQRWMVQTPALATAMSSRPSRSTPSADRGRAGRRRPARPPCAVTMRPPGLGHQPGRLVEVGRRGQRVGDGLEVAAQVDADDVGPLPGQADGVAPALAPGGTGDQRHLARHPAGAAGGPVAHEAAPTDAGRHGPRAPAPAADVQGQPPALEHGIEHAPRGHAVTGPQRARPRQVEGLLGEAMAAVDDDRARRWCAARPSTRPRGGPGRPGGRRSSARSSRRTPARCRRVLASARSPVRDSRVPATWSWVTRATSRPAPASHSATPTPTGPPTGSWTTTGPSGRRPAPCRSSASGSSTGHDRRRPGRRSAAGRDPVASTTSAPSAPGGVEVGGRHLDPGLDDDPLGAGTRPPATRPARPAARDPGPPPPPASAPPARSDRSTTRGRCPRSRQHPGAFEAGHARADDQHVPGRPDRSRRPGARSVSCPLRGSPTQLTIGLRLSRTWQAWLQRMQGRTREPSAAADQRHQAGFGDLGPGHLDQVGGPVVEGRLGHSTGRRHCPAARRRPDRPRPRASRGTARG